MEEGLKIRQAQKAAEEAAAAAKAASEEATEVPQKNEL